MEISGENKELFEALANFQKQVTDPKKDKKVGYGKTTFTYADLDSVLKAIRPLMAEQGLSFTQIPIVDNNRVGVVTMIMHCSGQYIKADPFLIPTQKQDAQGYGSCITYAKRYSLSALLGISADEDDDGNYGSATGRQAESIRQNQPANLPKGVAKGSDEEGWLNIMKKRLADKCTTAKMDKKFVTLCMELKFKKNYKDFNTDDYTSMVNNFDCFISDVQEEAMKKMQEQEAKKK